MSGSPGSTTDRRCVLVLDTATSRGVLLLGDRAGRVLASDAWTVGHRHGEELLPHLSSLLATADRSLADLDAIVVGTGPGAFTGLRVGLATAKALALSLDRPLVGISTAAALLDADREAGGRPGASLLLPAGPTDRVLVADGKPRLLSRDAAGNGVHGPTGGDEPTDGRTDAGVNDVAVDLDGRAADEPLARGRAALDGLGMALLRLGLDRLAHGEPDDLARLVPEYVTLPRGVREERGEVAWSRGRP